MHDIVQRERKIETVRCRAGNDGEDGPRGGGIAGVRFAASAVCYKNILFCAVFTRQVHIELVIGTFQLFKAVGGGACG